MTAQAVPDTGTVSYVYAVCRAEIPDPPPVHEGVAPLRLVRDAGLAAVVASAPAADFGTRALEARLDVLEELEALARVHHAVVDAVHARTAVLPMRLATVYRDDARVAEALRAHAGDFRRLLKRLAGHEELGVKVYAAPPPPEPVQDAVRPPGGDGGDSPGRAYLRRRQARRHSRRDAVRGAGEVAARLPGAVSGLARGRAVHRPQQGPLASGPGENIANEAYLVARSDLAEFREAVAALARGVPGVLIEVTGPWAPYSFTAHPGPEGAAAP